MKKKIAVILAGCGVFDGSEINEVVLTLLELEKNNLNYQCFAPDIDVPVVNHRTQEVSTETRNVLTESARIVRGNIQSLTELNASEFSGLIVTGGFGVAKNLSNFATEQENFTLQSDFEKATKAFYEQQKVAGYICIAPALLPKIYPSVQCTVGNDEATSTLINKMGGMAQATSVDEYYYDEKNKVLSTAAYMLASNITEAHQGISALVAKMSHLLSTPPHSSSLTS